MGGEGPESGHRRGTAYDRCRGIGVRRRGPGRGPGRPSRGYGEIAPPGLVYGLVSASGRGFDGFFKLLLEKLVVFGFGEDALTLRIFPCHPLQ